MQRRQLKRILIGAFAACAVLADAGGAAATAAASNEQVAITTPPAGSTAWVHDHSLGRPLPDPATADAATVAAFFASLTAAQQDRLAHAYPLVVGNLDGVPLRLRYQANTLALTAEVARAKAVAADRKADPTTHALAVSRANDCQALLRPGRQILAFDPRGRGLVTEVFGDLATAQRVSVIVPGSDTDLGHHDRAVDPLSAPAGMARALRAEEQAQAPNVSTAVIAWTGYVTPVGLGPDAVTSRLADAGAPRLARLLDGLKQTSAPAAPPTLLCHSYGTVVCGAVAPNCTARPPTWWCSPAPAWTCRTPTSWAPASTCGPPATPATGSASSRTCRSAAWGTAPTRPTRTSAPSRSPRPGPRATWATSTPAPPACTTSRRSRWATTATWSTAPADGSSADIGSA